MDKIFFKNIGIKWNTPLEKIEADLYLKPEDFIVEEIHHNSVCRVDTPKIKYERPKSQYVLALLIKKNISTFDACRILAIKNSLDPKEISFCGLKDSFGITAQLICIPNKVKLKQIKFKKFFITQFKPTNKKLSLRDHVGNHFIIRARNVRQDIKTCEKILEKVKAKIKGGLPNFYGPQRFGVRQKNHLYGKLLIKKRYKEFIERVLIDTGKYEELKIKNIRKKIKENMHDLKKCYAILSRVPQLLHEKEIVEHLLKENFEQTIKKSEILRFYLHSFSSYLFNLALSSLIEKTKGDFSKLKNFQLQKIGYNSKIDKSTFNLYSKILKKENLTFNELRLAFKKFGIEGRPRNVLFYPQNFIYSMKNKDIFLSFDLGVGEYATILLDFIFNNRLKPKLE